MESSLKLEYHGVIRVEGGVWPTLCWLRFFRGDSRHVVVLTEIPGNPGRFVPHAIENICKSIAIRFSAELADLQVFQILPRSLLTKADVQHVTFTGTSEEMAPRIAVEPTVPTLEGFTFTGIPEWRPTSRDGIATIVGDALPELPPHDELLDEVHQMGGGAFQRISRPIFEPVRCVDLPPPHNPSRCAHAARFWAMQAARDGNLDSELDAGRKFLESLTQHDVSTCSRHDGDWRWIADKSVELLEAVGPDRDLLIDAAEQVSGPGQYEEHMLKLLFAQPIDIAGWSYLDGQHRACAARMSGAAAVAVVVGDEDLGEEEEIWRYEGDG